MNTKDVIIVAVGLLLGVFLGWLIWGGDGALEQLPLDQSAGIGIGRRLEDYIPVILYNDGSYTERQFWVNASSTFEGVLNFTGAVNVNSTLSVGTLGTAINNIIFGTCNADGPSAGISASSTAIYQCAVTGVTSSDNVIVALPGGANVATGGTVDDVTFNGISFLYLTGSAFSTTSGVIGFELTNRGVASTSFAQATTGVQFWIFR